MFTAIVLDYDSQNRCIEKALALGVLPYGHPAKCHHVTLALGARPELVTGELRKMTVTHWGAIDGRVTAFAVEPSGAPERANGIPHVTVAIFGDAKPRESNDIQSWVPIERFEISGIVKVCD